MKIKVGDKVRIRNGSEGIIDSINIALDYDDKKAENGIKVENYDTELDYIGTIDFNIYDGIGQWAYFNQIVSVIPEEDIVVGTYDKVNEVLNGL